MTFSSDAVVAVFVALVDAALGLLILNAWARYRWQGRRNARLPRELGLSVGQMGAAASAAAEAGENLGHVLAQPPVAGATPYDEPLPYADVAEAPEEVMGAVRAAMFHLVDTGHGTRRIPLSPAEALAALNARPFENSMVMTTGSHQPPPAQVPQHSRSYATSSPFDDAPFFGDFYSTGPAFRRAPVAAPAVPRPEAVPVALPVPGHRGLRLAGALSEADGE